MLQVVNRADSVGAIATASRDAGSLLETPHPRATDARSRGIKFPISEQRTCAATGGRTGERTAENASDCPPADRELAAVIQAWPSLPDAIKAGIVAMVAATGQGAE